ncbi:peptidylprolyl isomerase, partial [Candidatus Pelagibacter sp.]|uniref:peptidylprolyl isomerase n=1 Tax=Candidatus Pelagibacter sp. TaxID=2024849 RepID=UPI003F84BB85
KVVINEEKLKQKILNNKEKQKQINVSEIVYETKNQEDLQSKYETIIYKINEIGFEKSVALFSISDSKKNSGKLGWVNESVLSDEILKKISNLNLGEISKPIMIPSGGLILKIEDRRILEKELDMEIELEKMISFEINSQLNTFSQILFNKIKDQIIIDEL